MRLILVINSIICIIKVIDYFELSNGGLHLIVHNRDRTVLPDEDITRQGLLTYSVEVCNAKIVNKKHLAWVN